MLALRSSAPYDPHTMQAMPTASFAIPSPLRRAVVWLGLFVLGCALMLLGWVTQAQEPPSPSAQQPGQQLEQPSQQVPTQPALEQAPPAAAPTQAPAEPAAASGGPRTAWVLTIDGAIGPASSHYVLRGLARAQEAGAAAVVLQMDTPGGLDTSMREIIRAILSSSVPVLSYVGPSGARAASAGTYILYASPIAAMAPGTNLGAATPVQIGGGGGSPMPGRQPAGDSPRPSGAPGGEPAPAGSGPGSTPGATGDGRGSPGAGATERPAPGRSPAGGGSATEAKVLNDAIAYIRSLAALHGRNADWAEAAVRDAASLSAEAALEQGVIDVVATSIPHLLRQVHGREVRLGEARLTLNTEGLQIEQHAPDWRARMLGVITNPNLALILMMVGIYGLIFEFMNPGALVPGTVGAISLLLGLYALSALPVSYVGVLLILLGIALMAAEAFSPSFGILGLGGVAAFVFGAMMLFDGEAPGYDVSIALVAGLALASLALTLLIVRMAVKTRNVRPVTGKGALLGQLAKVLDWQDGVGHVFAAGERWQADGPATLQAGQTVQIAAVRGLVLSVLPMEGTALPRLEPAR
jgi:membrane-bound serine protease (ClpP class)